MKVKAIAPWFGGKRTMAPDIVTELGEHTQYFEPFCGSMAVLFAKEPSQKETVCDLHGDLINLARVLQMFSCAEELYGMLQQTLFSEDLLLRTQDGLGKTPIHEALAYPGEIASVDRAYYYFLASWMGRNGTAGTARKDYQIAVRWTKNGGSPTVRWRNAVESIPAWHERLLNVVILCRDAFKIMDRFEDVSETAIYVDPPYPVESRSQGDGKARGCTYLHEFDHDTDHSRLSDILKTYKEARIVVSSYDCDRIRKLYDGWTFVDHTRQKQLHASAGRGSRGKEAPEVLIINGPSFAAQETTDQPSLF